MFGWQLNIPCQGIVFGFRIGRYIVQSIRSGIARRGEILVTQGVNL